MEQFKHHVSLHKDGTYSVGVSIDQGYMTPDDFAVLSELAKKYDDDKAYSFVNGVLNAISKKL